MIIRPYEESDKSSVVQLWKDCDLVVPWNDPALDIERKLGVQRDLFLVGVVEDQIVAVLMGGYDGHRGWVITWLFIQKGKKLGLRVSS